MVQIGIGVDINCYGCENFDEKKTTCAKERVELVGKVDGSIVRVIACKG